MWVQENTYNTIKKCNTEIAALFVPIGCIPVQRAGIFCHHEFLFTYESEG